ncbi:MAG: hypothetical protein A2252_09510 [Elusimicrobia bacterium RIFOXYA2_FULL_39_19]|nr:MAG: hypothetical protein A2252_09510 [Elusimicrobia bacterium RIFOXYA2_FULL_39_19]
MAYNKHWKPVTEENINKVLNWLNTANIGISKEVLGKWFKIYNMRISGTEYLDIANNQKHSIQTVRNYYFRAKKCVECLRNNNIAEIIQWAKWWGHYRITADR